MSWPTPQDYAEAVQNPKTCFEDSDLKQATAVTNPLGLPRAVSGQFACVFRFRSATGEWAVRCFLQEIRDQQDRYTLISSALGSAKLDCTVSFRFVDRGIRIRGKWYPILVMKWVQGTLLNDYVNNNLSNPSKLLDLAEKFLNLGTSLRKHGIAHGDLQHGNVLIVHDAPILIDYDGMFVPGLDGRNSHEIGHKNYQHPQRRENCFDAKVDWFSLWVIYLTLVALSEDPSLWKELDGGDDALIFRAADFKEPSNSRAISALQGRGKQRLGEIADALEDLCYKPLQRIPQPPGSIHSQPSSAPSGTSSVPKTGGATSPADGSWMNGWISSPAKAPPSAIPVDNEWLVSGVSATPNLVRYRNPPAVLGLLLIILLSPLPVIAKYFFVSLPLGFLPYAGISFILYAAAALGIKRLHRRDGAVQARIEALREQAVRAKEKEDIEERLKQTLKAIASARAGRTAQDQAIGKTLTNIQNDLNRAETAARQQLNTTRTQLQSERNRLDSTESNEVQTVDSRFSSRISDIRNRRDRLKYDEQNEIARALQSEQESFVRSYLANFPMSSASISGIGDILKSRLISAGVRTAADAEGFRVANVSGIGEQKAAAIKRWRNGLVSAAQARQPQSLNAATAGGIRARFQAQILGYQSNLSQLESQRDAEKSAIRSKIHNLRKGIDDRLASAARDCDQRVASVKVDAAKRQAAAKQSFEAKMQAIDTDIRSREGALTKMQQEISGANYRLAFATGKVDNIPMETMVVWIAQNVKNFRMYP